MTKQIMNCPLCTAGFPLKEGTHLPTQSLGMIPASTCRLLIPRGAIKTFRLYLNYKHANDRHANGRFHQRTREYGDYLYAQDRDAFLKELCEWLPTHKD